MKRILFKNEYSSHSKPSYCKDILICLQISMFIHVSMADPYHTIPTFNDPEKRPFENILGKGEKCW